jgi:hypothetical protein
MVELVLFVVMFGMGSIFVIAAIELFQYRVRFLRRWHRYLFLGVLAWTAVPGIVLLVGAGFVLFSAII